MRIGTERGVTIRINVRLRVRVSVSVRVRVRSESGCKSESMPVFGYQGHG